MHHGVTPMSPVQSPSRGRLPVEGETRSGKGCQGQLTEFHFLHHGEGSGEPKGRTRAIITSSDRALWT